MDVTSVFGLLVTLAVVVWIFVKFDGVEKVRALVGMPTKEHKTK